LPPPKRRQYPSLDVEAIHGQLHGFLIKAFILNHNLNLLAELNLGVVNFRLGI